MEKSLAQIVADLPPEQREEILADLDLETLLWDWRFWGRPTQLTPLDSEEWSVCAYLGGRGTGKGLGLDTPIPTPSGWTTMGELKDGDLVFDEQGNPCRVIQAHDPYIPEVAYRLSFTDGTDLYVDGEHQWVTWTHRDRKSYGRVVGAPDYPEDWVNWSRPSYTNKHDQVIPFDEPIGPRVRTTQDIVDTFYQGKRGDLNHSIPLAAELNLPDADLPLDPYVLGYWLGDGSHAGSELWVGREDQAWVLGEMSTRLPCVNVSIRPSDDIAMSLAGGDGFVRQRLRELGVLKGVGEKHVPPAYFRASTEQRLDLLRGLMDSDGFVNPANSVVEFCNTNKALALAVLELARSLSERPVLSESRATLYGKDCGPKYRVTWRPSRHVPFRLPRKAATVRPTGAQSLRTRQRMITAYTEVEIRTVRCITVDSPNSMYLAGRGMIPTHNTRTSSEWVREKAKRMPGSRGALVARTAADVRDVMIQGESGIMAVSPPSERPLWEPSKRLLTWPNGSTAIAFTSDEPSQLRGPQFHWASCDEWAAWKWVPDDSGLTAWDNVRIATRLGQHPQVFAMTTPKRIPALKALLAEADEHPERVLVLRGSTMENAGNLSAAYLDVITGLYAGTSLARQELYGEMLDSAEGTLWQEDLIDPLRVSELPSGLTVVVGVDPSVSENPRDECGIVVVGATRDRKMYRRHGFVIEDASVHGSPATWARRVVAMAEKYKAPVVAEINQGGALVRGAIHGINPGIRVIDVRAHVGKALRAEPVVLAYEQRRIHHLNVHPDLESQMLSWIPGETKKSPDRVDALVHALSALVVKQPPGFSAGGARTRSPRGGLPQRPIKRR